MGFSWQILGKDGEDLCNKYNINSQALNLGANGYGESRHDVSDIRQAFISVPFKEDHRPAAIVAVVACQQLARENLQALQPHHCETCQCPEKTPVGWSKEAVEDFLRLPTEEVYSASGGY